ncbi:MAG TPA: beta-ketoacyl synthase N-terminal-like domain-containing protein [Salinimicrobium sp.]|nr:beta-ketoacyl synthase N-terminal-like domain-containing protein [Salinimicrobium sp.]
MNPISISSIASISALGTTSEEVWKSYKNRKALFSEKEINGSKVPVSEISRAGKAEIEILRNSNRFYKNLDDSVLFAIFAARKMVEISPSFEGGRWEAGKAGINIGSSRGATQLFEKHHQLFLETGKAETLASPTTTLGNISSWVAQDLGVSGPVLSHSITCSTALHSFLNGSAWLNSGMSDTFLVGGSETPLTNFTIAQMQSLKLLKSPPNGKMFTENHYPCESLKFNKKANSMILGEAAGMACLEIGNPAALANITGMGYATEKLTHNISISADAECFQKSMKMALESANLKSVDAVVMHAPGTIKGDLAELNAIKKTFPTPKGQKGRLPALTSNKWLIGHSFGASGIMSMEMAVLMLQHQEFIGNPFYSECIPDKINSVMVNAVGFGGNAVSLVISRNGE